MNPQATPRKTPPAKPSAYRPDQRKALDKIEAARKEAGFTVAVLAQAASISERSYYGQLRAGRAFPRVVQALTMALRTLQKGDTAAGEWFP